MSIKIQGSSGNVADVDSSGNLKITGTLTPSGTQNVNIVSGVELEFKNDTGNPLPVSATALPLPAGASTETTLAAINTKTPALGQAASAASVPVVLPSAQASALAQDATLTGGTAKSINRGGAKGATTAADITSTAEGTDHQALDVQIYHSGTAVNPTQIRALTSADQVTTVPSGTQTVSGTVAVTQATGTNLHTVVDSGSINVSNFPATQPISGSVTANIGTTNGLALDTTVNGLLKPSSTLSAVGSITNTVIVKADTAVNQTNALKVDGSAVTQPISASSLPLPTGAATAAKQPAIGTAGTPSADVLTVQGSASMTAIKVDGSAITQPVSGSVSVSNFPATQTVAGTITVTQATGTNLHTVVDSSALPTGASTSAAQTTGNASLSSLDSKTPALGQALAAASVPVVLTAAQLSTLTPLTSVAVTQPTGTNLHTVIDSGSVAMSAMVPDVSFATQNITVQDTGSTTAAGQNAQTLISGTPTAGSVATFNLTTAETAKVQVLGTWTGTLSSEVSIDGGTTWATTSLKQTGSSYTITTFTANMTGSANVAGCTQYRIRATGAMTGTATVKVVSSVNEHSSYIAGGITVQDATVSTTRLAIKAASTAAVATDTAVVMTISPNTPLPTGSNALGSVSVSNFPATQAISAASLPLPTGAATSAAQATLLQGQSSTATLSNITSSASNSTLLAANTSRKGALFFNDSTANLFLKFGATASSTSFTVKVTPGALFELPTPCYTGIIDGIWASANGACRVTELT